MKVCIDLDGVITRYPEIMRLLATALMDRGDAVIILTAAAGELPKEQRPTEVARRLLALRMPYHELVCCESCEKPDYCRNHNVDVLIDDGNYSMDSKTAFLKVI